MASMDTLCGVGSLANFANFFFMASGLTPGNVYGLMEADVTPTNPDHSLGITGTADANGDLTLGLASSNRTSKDITLHFPAGSTALIDRVANAGAVTWSAGGPAAAYLTGPVTLSGKPGDTTAWLTWTAAGVCDVRSTVSYVLKRGATTILTTTTLFELLDTGRTNGTLLTYQVTATLFVPGRAGGVAAIASNSLPLRPRGQTTYLGSLVTH